MVWYGMVWYGMVWYGMVWYGVVWYGMYECMYTYVTYVHHSRISHSPFYVAGGIHPLSQSAGVVFRGLPGRKPSGRWTTGEDCGSLWSRGDVRLGALGPHGASDLTWLEGPEMREVSNMRWDSCYSILSVSEDLNKLLAFFGVDSSSLWGDYGDTMG